MFFFRREYNKNNKKDLEDKNKIAEFVRLEKTI